ncbi:MAG: hypothetical protein HRU19_01045 [Pseudobacteriovorax sp.]|nr:hypothetical protein [Pseudobacteriovorax sp.]
MRVLIILGLFSSLLLSCQIAYEETNPFNYQDANIDFFQPFMNDADGKPESDLILVNHAYPIEVTLRSDGSFYYFLENLGDGVGSWKHEGNRISLYAERDLFIMKLYLHKAEGVDMPVIEFRDRHKANYLHLGLK